MNGLPPNTSIYIDIRRLTVTHEHGGTKSGGFGKRRKLIGGRRVVKLIFH